MGLLSLFPAATSGGENWPDFRGPHFDGRTSATSLPLVWSEQQNIRWKTAIPGLGHSTPVIWEDKIWLTTATSDGTQLFALQVSLETGEIQRRVKLFDVSEPQPINGMNSYASPSPVIDKQRLYVHFGTYGTAAIETATGKILWQRSDLTLDHREGPGSSPVLFGDLLILTCDGTDVQYVIALDTKTGETRWKTNRSIDFGNLNPDFRKAYSTPLLAQVGGQPQLITTGAHSAYGYDPASGKELWRVAYEGFSNVCRPAVADGMMFLNTGYMKPQMLAVKLGGGGLLGEDQLVWKQASGASNKPSVVITGGLLFQVSDGGVASCLDTKTGEVVWTKRLGGNFSASPLLAGDRIYLFDHKGKAIALKAGREFEQLAENQLDDGFMASPAVAGNALILRTTTCLYRVEAAAAR